MNGIEKQIDDLGRIVIPMKFRKVLGIDENSSVLVSLENDTVIIKSTIRHCALCGEKTAPQRDIRLCESCILKIKRDL